MKITDLRMTVLILLSVLYGCAGMNKYEVLSFFFDGVPSPDTSKIIPSETFTTITTSTQNDSTDHSAEIASVASMHRPYAQKKCRDCHDETSMSESTSEILKRCKNCHSAFQKKYKYVHGPVAVLDCISCHEPHKSENASLLRRSGDFICTYCHKNLDLVQVNQHSQIGIIECLGCHNPHYSNENKFYVLTRKSDP